MRNHPLMYVAAVVGVLTLVSCSMPGPRHPPSGTVAVSVPQIVLNPPAYEVTLDRPGGGYVFLSTGADPAASIAAKALARHPDGSTAQNSGGPGGPEIVDKAGKPVWFKQMKPGTIGGNLEVQTYHGQSVLTWWEGVDADDGVDYIADSSYRNIAAVKVAGGLQTNIHEFRLVPGGRALITATRVKPYDLSPYGGPKDGKVWDNIAVVVDIATGNTVFEWSALDHVPVSDTYLPYSQSLVDFPSDFYNPFLMNAIDQAPNGDLLISLRHMSAVLDVDSTTGKVNWQLGGKHSTLAMGSGVEFAFQHDPEFDGNNTVRLYDNGSMDPKVPGPSSKAKWIRIDPIARTAALEHSITAPGDVSTWCLGSVQDLPDGNVFVAWGSSRRIAEYAKDGTMVYEAQTGGDQARSLGATYRAHLLPWTARPAQAPQAVVVALDADGTSAAVHALWNGATEVKRWRLMHGENANKLAPVATVDWNGLDTTIVLRSGPATGYFVVEALDVRGDVIGRSAPTYK